MKKKLNTGLLNEEINRYKLLCEYDFYQDKKEPPTYKDAIEEEDVPDDLEPATADSEKAANNVTDDLGVDSDEVSGEIGEPEPQPEEENEPTAEAPVEPEPDSDAVEVDVTSLVKGSNEAKQAADMASHNSEMLLKKLGDLENRIARMDSVSAKIEDLEKEIIKRNPTPVEKLEMRSLNSYPYSQKLTDYWADKEGPYNVMNTPKEKEEYILTKDEIESDYNDGRIKQSFNVNPDDLYSEEDV